MAMSDVSSSRARSGLGASDHGQSAKQHVLDFKKRVDDLEGNFDALCEQTESHLAEVGKAVTGELADLHSNLSAASMKMEQRMTIVQNRLKHVEDMAFEATAEARERAAMIRPALEATRSRLDEHLPGTESRVQLLQQEIAKMALELEDGTDGIAQDFCSDTLRIHNEMVRMRARLSEIEHGREVYCPSVSQLPSSDNALAADASNVSDISNGFRPPAYGFGYGPCAAWPPQNRPSAVQPSQHINVHSSRKKAPKSAKKQSSGKTKQKSSRKHPAKQDTFHSECAESLEAMQSSPNADPAITAEDEARSPAKVTKELTAVEEEGNEERIKEHKTDPFDAQAASQSQEPHPTSPPRPAASVDDGGHLLSEPSNTVDKDNFPPSPAAEPASGVDEDNSPPRPTPGADEGPQLAELSSTVEEPTQVFAAGKDGSTSKATAAMDREPTPTPAVDGEPTPTPVVDVGSSSPKPLTTEDEDTKPLTTVDEEPSSPRTMAVKEDGMTTKAEHTAKQDNADNSVRKSSQTPPSETAGSGEESMTDKPASSTTEADKEAASNSVSDKKSDEETEREGAMTTSDGESSKKEEDETKKKKHYPYRFRPVRPKTLPQRMNQLRRLRFWQDNSSDDDDPENSAQALMEKKLREQVEIGILDGGDPEHFTKLGKLAGSVMAAELLGALCASKGKGLPNLHPPKDENAAGADGEKASGDSDKAGKDNNPQPITTASPMPAGASSTSTTSAAAAGGMQGVNFPSIPGQSNLAAMMAGQGRGASVGMGAPPGMAGLLGAMSQQGQGGGIPAMAGGLNSMLMGQGGSQQASMFMSQRGGQQPQPNQQQQAEIVQHINDAYRQLLSMGYKDDGGYLQELVIQYQGDVSRVIDFLGPADSSGGGDGPDVTQQSQPQLVPQQIAGGPANYAASNIAELLNASSGSEMTSAALAELLARARSGETGTAPQLNTGSGLSLGSHQPMGMMASMPFNTGSHQPMGMMAGMPFNTGSHQPMGTTAGIPSGSGSTGAAIPSATMMSSQMEGVYRSGGTQQGDM